MTPHIRPMITADLEAIITLAESTPGAPHWPNGEYPKILAQVQTGKVAVFVALTDNQLIGFAITRLVLDIGQLESIVVDPVFHRRGIGAALLNAILAWVRERGVRRIELEVRESNTAAIALYKANGFEQEGVRRSYYSAPAEDALLMSLSLNDLRKEK